MFGISTVITIAGRKHWLWRAVDQDGYALDEIVQNRRNTKTAKRLLNQLLKKQGIAPKRMMQGFRSAGGLQCFTSVFSAVRNLFVPPRSQRSALSTHLHRLKAIAAWKIAANAFA
jgi:putative transposase